MTAFVVAFDIQWHGMV